MLHHNHDAKAARLASLPLFASADRVAVRHLASATDEVTVEAGRNLITQGHRHHEAYVVVSGELRVLVDDQEVARLGDGSIVGEIGLFVPGPAAATVVTTAPSDLLVIPYNRFDQVLDDVPSLARHMAVELAQRLRNMNLEFGPRGGATSATNEPGE
jgi:CRP/FNR family transcriptional regulator, cyclic AMP receptor protein